MKLSIDFAQDRDMDAISAKVLAFLKDNAVGSGIVDSVVRGSGRGGATVKDAHVLTGLPVETEAGMIASFLAKYSKGKDGYLYDGATLVIRRFSKSMHKVVCGICNNAMTVSETPVETPMGAARTHLHYVCEQAGCAAHGQVSHKDVICSGSPICGVHDSKEWHDNYEECPGGHGCGCV